MDISPAASGIGTNLVTVTSPGTRTITNSLETLFTETLPSFGVAPGDAGLSGEALDASGEPAVAGSHPYVLLLRTHTPTVQSGNVTVGVESFRRLFFRLPAGLVANPQATPRCSFPQLNGSSKEPSEECPPDTQVGRVQFSSRLFSSAASSLFNLVPQKGVPAEFAFGVDGAFVHIRGGLDGNFDVTAGSTEIFTKFEVHGVAVELWGDPSAEAHDLHRFGGTAPVPPERGCRPESSTGCAVERTLRPFITMPSACSPTLSLGVECHRVVRLQLRHRNGFHHAFRPTETVTGCERLSFVPTITIQPSSGSTESPTGLNVDLKVPQNENANGLATATVKKVVVHLPAGMTVNPSAANGLGACSPAQIGIGNEQPASCPPSSKVGTAEIITPLLESPAERLDLPGRTEEQPVRNASRTLPGGRRRRES